MMIYVSVEKFSKSKRFFTGCRMTIKKRLINF
jgi:hypothetical protein